MTADPAGARRRWQDFRVSENRTSELAGRLRDGKYFATIVRKEDCCWIRGNMCEDIVFLMDNKRPSEDKPVEAGSFYNTAPRFSVVGSSYVSCERVK